MFFSPTYRAAAWMSILKSLTWNVQFCMCTKNCIEQVKQIMAGTSGCDIVYDRRAYVLGVDVNDGVYLNNERQQSEHNSGISVLVTRKEYLEGVLSQAQQDHERQQRIQRDVHGENQNTHEQIKVKVHPKPFEPTKEERQSHEATVFPLVGVKSASKPRALTENTPNSLENAEHIFVIEFDYAFATDTPGDPNRKISMMGCDRWVNFRCRGRDTGWTGWLCDAEFPKLHRIGWDWSGQS